MFFNEFGARHKNLLEIICTKFYLHMVRFDISIV